MLRHCSTNKMWSTIYHSTMKACTVFVEQTMKMCIIYSISPVEKKDSQSRFKRRLYHCGRLRPSLILLMTEFKLRYDIKALFSDLRLSYTTFPRMQRNKNYGTEHLRGNHNLIHSTSNPSSSSSATSSLSTHLRYLQSH